MPDVTAIHEALANAEREIRALARKIGWERREIVQALEAHASIEQAQRLPQRAQQIPGEPGKLSRMPVVPAPKDSPRRSEEYRRWVSSLPCANCGRDGPSQCAHSDTGKGLGIKAGDDTTFPLCADRPGERGCHTLIGASGVYGREGRRTLETVYSDATARMARATGNWPLGWD